MPETFTTLRSLKNTINSIDKLLTTYHEAQREDVKDALVNEVSALTIELLSDVDATSDLLGTAYSVLAAAIELPQCDGCCCEE
jgi:hypothetical protein